MIQIFYKICDFEIFSPILWNIFSFSWWYCLLKILFLSLLNCLEICQKSIHHKCIGLFLNRELYFIDLYVYFYFQVPQCCDYCSSVVRFKNSEMWAYITFSFSRYILFFWPLWDPIDFRITLSVSTNTQKSSLEFW